MKFIDQAKIFVKAGSGGNGSASFRREKFVEFGGPDGGDGGDGGSVYAIGVKDVNSLIEYHHKQHITAEDGENGLGRNKTGKSGADIYIKIPIGTEIYDAQTNSLICDMIYHGQMHKLASGGKGGQGNVRFKSSTNRAPREFGKGVSGEELSLILQLKLIANVGIIGMPNAGKSTILSIISEARPKIADYPFTTITPNLGVAKIYEKDIVFADIPGMIEHAHLGKGLGIEFLRHIQRCSILLHVINISEDISNNYKIIKNELLQYNKNLANKLEIIVLNKSDLIDDENLKNKMKEIELFEQKYLSIIQDIISSLDESPQQQKIVLNDWDIDQEFDIYDDTENSDYDSLLDDREKECIFDIKIPKIFICSAKMNWKMHDILHEIYSILK
ncbi:GTPase ObgE [Candidatus Gromoviella agglomerans]|uniref:GTPase ObgE n=1 Tax=Candidatus Gromoviella agglomerans TaxID=2806609 RepID=UPI001E56793C|nr:GTPase ObgE [Candidatus Gromoviella agglomerans]UFX98188.1 GTPase ObgE [Candidatus Gromoviella agglomerans]